jgi:CRISPR system Cascade subunit CasE
MSLYMLQLHLDPAALVHFLAAHRLNREADGDWGYGIHAWLAATFGALAPRPFRLYMDPRNQKPPKLLGYSAHGREALLDHALSFAEPTARAVCPVEQDLALAPLPGPERWRPGRRLGFEVLACPVARRSRDGVERDVFLHHADRAPADAGLSRESIYRDWLATQLTSAAAIETAALERFYLVRQLRRGRKGEEGRRSRTRLMRPAAVLSGVLNVLDGTGFQALLSRGIGRHRAFGYGMLLVRPA